MIAPFDSERVRKCCIAPETTIADAVERLERAETGMLMLRAEDDTLAGVLTDGDIRRALLKGIPFDRPCSTIATARPIVAEDTISEEAALHLMDAGTSFPINHLPIVDASRKIRGLLLRRDLVTLDTHGLAAVILAGGFGTRLQPLTNNTPKPMLPIGDRPLLELTIERLRKSGIRRVNIATHYLAEKITSHFGNGNGFGVEVNYVNEDRPLGTAGALRLMDLGDTPVLVVNGDILTRVDFTDMLACHLESGAMATVGVRPVEFVFPYGVVECDGSTVNSLQEKPHLTFLINAGIYLLNPTAYRYIPEDRRYDMTDLLQRLLTEGHRVVSFPVVESWIDIGRHADYERAQRMVSHDHA